MASFTPAEKFISFMSDHRKAAGFVFLTSVVSGAVTGLVAARDAEDKTDAMLQAFWKSALGAAGGAVIYLILLRDSGFVTSARWRRIWYAAYFALPFATMAAQAITLAIPAGEAHKRQTGAGIVLGLFALAVSLAIFHKYIEPLSLSNGPPNPQGLVFRGMDDKLKQMAAAGSP